MVFSANVLRNSKALSALREPSDHLAHCLSVLEDSDIELQTQYFAKAFLDFFLEGGILASSFIEWSIHICQIIPEGGQSFLLHDNPQHSQQDKLISLVYFGMAVPALLAGDGQSDDCHSPKGKEEENDEQSKEDKEEPLCLAVMVPTEEVFSFLTESDHLSQGQLSLQKDLLKPIVFLKDISLLFLALNQGRSTILKSYKNLRFSYTFFRLTLKLALHLFSCRAFQRAFTHQLDHAYDIRSLQYTPEAGWRYASSMQAAAREYCRTWLALNSITAISNSTQKMADLDGYSKLTNPPIQAIHSSMEQRILLILFFWILNSPLENSLGWSTPSKRSLSYPEQQACQAVMEKYYSLMEQLHCLDYRRWLRIQGVFLLGLSLQS